MTSNAAVAMAIASAPAATLFSPRPLPVAGRTIPVGRGVAAPPSTAFDSDVGVVSAAVMLAVGLAVCAAVTEATAVRVLVGVVLGCRVLVAVGTAGLGVIVGVYVCVCVLVAVGSLTVGVSVAGAVVGTAVVVPPALATITLPLVRSTV